MKKNSEIPAQWQRRDFVKFSSGLAILLGLPQLSSAGERKTNDKLPAPKQPLPLVDARFPCRIADGIWLITDKRISLVPNIGIVEGDDAVLVIDSGINSALGKNVLAAAKAIAGKRKIILTITHAHPEHTFGAQAFKGETKIYYNRQQRDYLAQNGENLLKGFRLLLPPEQLKLLEDVKITLPDEIYDGKSASLNLGNRKVLFQTWGTAHSPGDQIITIPDQKVIFAGDLIEERKFPIVPFYPPMIQQGDINLKTWENALIEITAKKPHIIIPGHGNLGGTEIAMQVVDYFKDTRKMVAEYKGKKTPDSMIVKQLEPIVQSHYPTWEQDEFIAPALRFLVQET